ncbi:sickle tail protein homolog isoform X9 [Chanodichthys erythropterus]|uniref:sickle tail protein homolog isoform X9 n=1 Tax=Chanodichthys erythropterus TaxID=933992 RepID=UPI00351E922C
MSKPSRLARPSSAGPGSKLPSPRRDTPAGRSRMLGMGEKVMRTGSEGNIAGQRPPINGTTHSHIKQNTNIKEEDEVAQPRSRISPPKGSTASITQQQVTQPKPLKGNLKVTSSEDAEHLTRKQQVVSANSPGFRCEPKSARAGAPRRHTVGGARSSREILAMQPSDMDKKREAFLEHLKQKYPHHASAIMGHQERLREQNRSSKQSVVCSSPVPVFVDQVEHDSLVSLDALEVMSECDMPIAFTRGSRSRASLPVVRSTNQTKDRSLGVLYLQYGDDTKQIRMPNEITSVDTVRALFVSAFPHQLNMKMLESPSTAIYVKDETRNVYYELTDVRNITDHSCLKVYHKDPAHAFSHGARPSNGDARVHREMMYAGRDGHPLRQPPMGPPPPHMQGSMSPTTPHALPPSPSRIPFGPRTSGGGVATMPRERAGHTLPTPARASSPCPSAILERRDVKPDEDVAAKSMSLPSRAESHYADPYMLHHQALPPDAVDHAYHRATIRSYSNPGVPMEPMDHHSLFRQKSRKYTDSQLPMLGSKTPPSSPHRMGEMRMMDIHTGQPQSSMTLERASPVRQSFRKEAPVTMDTMVKTRGGMGSPATPDLQVHNPLAPSTDPQTRERMKAMEEQIASLTGLVQHALLKSHSTNSNKEHPSEKPVKSGSPAHSTSSTGGSPVLPPKLAAAPPEHSPAPTPPLGPAPLHVNLHLFRRNVSELRLQLQHIRQLQLQNQECVRAQIKHAEQEISVKLAEILRRQDDPTQKQRTLVEEERHRYLSMQERVLTQLGDLEQYVEALRTDSSPAVSQRAVTLKEVEEGAVSLRKVGENLAGLKGEFPALQAHMRAVLRVEVEAVKFLKEEPHKLDSMLKRVRTLTDTLGNLRRCATDSLLNPSDPVPSTPASEKAESAIVESFEPASVIPQSSIVRSEVMSSSPMVIHHAQASPVASQQSLKSTAPSPIPPAAQRRESTPSPTKQLKKTSLEQTQIPNTSSNGVSANDIHSKGPSPNLLIEEIQASHSKNMNRAVSIEAAEKGWEEKRQNIGHYDGQEFERMLQEAEANMLRGIPNLEVPSKLEGSPAPPASLEEVIEKNEPTAAPTEQNDNQPNSEKPTKTAPEKPPKPLEKAVKSALERPIKPSLSIKSNLERQNKTQEKVKLQTTEKANKSPPPPPPRRNYTTNTGMTTTRSGEVIYTSRKESVTEGEEESNSTASQSEPKTPPEAKRKPITPPPIAASAITEEEDEGDKIMAELQVFQKCSVKEVGLKGLVEPQIRELRPGVLLPLKDKKNTENQDDKNPDTDENGNNTIRQSPGVIYYVTAQISKGTSSASEESTERRDASQSPPSQNASVVSPTSRMPVPVSAKARQQPGTSDKERATKPQKLQDSQRQFRQANGSAKRSGGDPKSTSPTVPASKIPAFSSSTGKGLSQSDSTNIVNSSPLSSSLPTSKSSIPPPRSNSTPSSHIPSLSNGSLKFAPPTHSTKGLSIPMQTQNGRPSTSSSSSCSHSPLSPTMLSQSAKSIRTIHTPSFTSYSRPHNGSAGKSAIPTVTVAKDAA